MIFFQTWVGETISHLRIEHIQSAHNCLDDGDTHIIATNTPELFLGIGCEIVDFFKLFNRHMNDLSFDRREYFGHTTWTAMEKTNFVRVAEAAIKPDLFYLDTDVYLRSRPVLELAGPYFSREPQRINAFCVNGDPEIFRDALLYWPPCARRDFYNRFRLFPNMNLLPECYEHHQLRGLE